MADDVEGRGVRIRAPLSASTLSWRGELYRAGDDGIFTVPNAAFSELERHGFTRVTDYHVGAQKHVRSVRK